jgi:hypothetical protein
MQAIDIITIVFPARRTAPNRPPTDLAGHLFFGGTISFLS